MNGRSGRGGEERRRPLGGWTWLRMVSKKQISRFVRCIYFHSEIHGIFRGGEVKLDASSALTLEVLDTVTALSFLFTESFGLSIGPTVAHQRGAKDRCHEKPIRLSARPDSTIGCRVCVC